MQVGPRSWLGTETQLKDPAFNIFVGMRMLSSTLEKTDGDIRFALGAYNCGFVGLFRNRCGRWGGLAYADKILDYWLPVFRAELTVRAGEDDEVGEWLASLGYREGLGDWEVMPETEEVEECRIELPMRRFRPHICRR